MNYLYAVIIAGNTLATQLFLTEEACQGHKVVFDRDHKVTGICVKMPAQAAGSVSISSWGAGSILQCCGNSNVLCVSC